MVRSNASERVQNVTVKVMGRESDLLITFYMLKHLCAVLY